MEDNSMEINLFFAGRRIFLGGVSNGITSNINNIVSNSSGSWTSFAYASLTSRIWVGKEIEKELLTGLFWSTLRGGVVEIVVVVNCISILQLTAAPDSPLASPLSWHCHEARGSLRHPLTFPYLCQSLAALRSSRQPLHSIRFCHLCQIENAIP